MSQTTEFNRRFVLAERPNGPPDENTLRLEETEVPQPGDGADVVAHRVSLA